MPYRPFCAPRWRKKSCCSLPIRQNAEIVLPCLLKQFAAWTPAHHQVEKKRRKDFLNGRTQRGIYATTYPGCWIAVGLVKAEDAKPNRARMPFGFWWRR